MSPFRKLWTTTVLNQRGGEAEFELTLIETALAFGLTRKRLVNSVAEELEEKTVLYNSSKTRWSDAKSNEVNVLESRVLLSFKQQRCVWRGASETMFKKKKRFANAFRIEIYSTNDCYRNTAWRTDC